MESNKIPDVLYKYRPWNDYTKKILTDGELYFPSIGKLNDPFEGSIPYIFDQSELTTENIFRWMYKLAKHDHPTWTEIEIYKYVCEEQKKDVYLMKNTLRNKMLKQGKMSKNYLEY